MAEILAECCVGKNGDVSCPHSHEEHTYLHAHLYRHSLCEHTAVIHTRQWSGGDSQMKPEEDGWGKSTEDMLTRESS